MTCHDVIWHDMKWRDVTWHDVTFVVVNSFRRWNQMSRLVIDNCSLFTQLKYVNETSNSDCILRCPKLTTKLTSFIKRSIAPFRRYVSPMYMASRLRNTRQHGTEVVEFTCVTVHKSNITLSIFIIIAPSLNIRCTLVNRRDCIVVIECFRLLLGLAFIRNCVRER